MIKEAIIKLSKKENLNDFQAYSVMNEIMSGAASDVQMSAYLTALSLKGASINEIVASARSMREHCIKILNNADALEIVGTGGDNSNSFNISTTASIIVASAGVKVAKHGNRSASSKCGAADVLEALGANLNISPDKAQAMLDSINFCFLFAQNHHLSMKYVAPIRKELGIKTIFNLLGPLCNPAGANMELMGVYEESLVEPLAEVMKNLGVKNGMVVYGLDCIDEISLSSDTKITQIKNGELSTFIFNPESVGYKKCEKSALNGGDAAINAQIIKDIFSTKEVGAKRQAACLNAGAALYIANVVDSINDGVRLAEHLIDSKKAESKLLEFIKESNKWVC